MIDQIHEDVNFSYELLRYFYGLPFPTAKTSYDVQNEFSGVDIDKINFHLYLLNEYGFIHGTVNLISDSSGSRIVVGVLNGLKSKGRELVSNFSDDRWSRAWANIVENDRIPTVNSMAEEVDNICRFESNDRYVDKIVDKVVERLVEIGEG